MPTEPIVVHCEFTTSEKTLPEILEEDFRLYLARILASNNPDAVSCSQ